MNFGLFCNVSLKHKLATQWYKSILENILISTIPFFREPFATRLLNATKACKDGAPRFTVLGLWGPDVRRAWVLVCARPFAAIWAHVSGHTLLKSMPISLCKQISLRWYLSSLALLGVSFHMYSDDAFTRLRAAPVCWLKERELWRGRI